MTVSLADAPTRPVLRYHGGKWKIAPWVLAHFPPHRVYVEAFGGAASILMRKPRVYGEVYNELDGDVVNLFQVLRDEASSIELRRRLHLTPFSRADFEESYLPSQDSIEKARRLVVRSFMGFGSNAHQVRRKTGFRANSNRSGTLPAHDWAGFPEALSAITERLRGVVVENRDAIEVALQHDGDETLHYWAPPYLHSMRAKKNPYDPAYVGYFKEMTDTEHEHMLQVAMELRGMVVISGYPSEMYDGALLGWRREQITALADGARERTEVLWLNPLASDRLEAAREQPNLFPQPNGFKAERGDTINKGVK